MLLQVLQFVAIAVGLVAAGFVIIDAETKRRLRNDARDRALREHSIEIANVLSQYENKFDRLFSEHGETSAELVKAVNGLTEILDRAQRAKLEELQNR